MRWRRAVRAERRRCVRRRWCYASAQRRAETDAMSCGRVVRRAMKCSAKHAPPARRVVRDATARVCGVRS